jgi:hypothetical protein
MRTFCGYCLLIFGFVLAVLGIDSVPVLVVKGAEGFRFIKGERQIVNYVRHACFTKADVMYFKQNVVSGHDYITVLTEQQGECSLAIDCNQT